MSLNETAPRVLSQEYYGRLYTLEEQHWWFQATRQIAGALLDARLAGKTGLKALDAGCGTGIMLGWLERYTRPENIFGIDVTEYALDFCRERGHKQLALASALALPFPDQSFDLVISADVIQHLPRAGGDEQALREMARVLKPGGLLYLRTNASLGVGQVEAEVDASYQRYNRAELMAKFRAAGLQVEQATYINLVMSLWSTAKQRVKALRSNRQAKHQPEDNNHHSHHHNHDRGLALRVPKPAWLNRLLFEQMALEARYLARPGRALPFGHSQVFVLRKQG